MATGGNPYSSPMSYGSGGGGPNHELALQKIKPPAITLLVVTIIMMLLVVLGLVLNILGVGLAANAVNQGAGGGAAGPDAAMMMFQGTIGIISGLVGLVVGGVVIFGCTKMMKLQAYELAMAAFIISMIPCISPCCITGIPIGIWGLMMLNDPAVKSAFGK